MSLTELRCPSCTAPVPASDGAAITCRFCGATLVREQPTTGRHEKHYTLVLRVAPSNRERVAQLLAEKGGLDLERARALIADSPAQIQIGSDSAKARDLERAASEAAAQAELTMEKVTVPVVDVVLESVGAKKLAVIVALRDQIEMSIAEAKQLVGSAPVTIATGIEEPEASAMISALQAAGATARAK